MVVYNRIWCTKRCLESIKDLGQPITLINNGSDYKPFLKWLKTQPYPVWEFPKIHCAKDLWRHINIAVRIYKKRNGPIDAYVMTDPDIELENSHLPWIETMYKVLMTHPRVNALSPSLRIDDIPDYYPLKKRAIGSEGGKTCSFIDCWGPWFTDKNGLRMRRAHVDTTFSMYRPNFNKKQVTRKAIRLAEPYIARHLDWYLDPKNLTKDQIAYFKASGRVTHFGGPRFKRKMNEKKKKKRRAMNEKKKKRLT